MQLGGPTKTYDRKTLSLLVGFPLLDEPIEV